MGPETVALGAVRMVCMVDDSGSDVSTTVVYGCVTDCVLFPAGGNMLVSVSVTGKLVLNVSRLEDGDDSVSLAARRNTEAEGYVVSLDVFNNGGSCDVRWPHNVARTSSVMLLSSSSHP